PISSPPGRALGRRAVRAGGQARLGRRLICIRRARRRGQRRKGAVGGRQLRLLRALRGGGAGGAGGIRLTRPSAGGQGDAVTGRAVGLLARSLTREPISQVTA